MPERDRLPDELFDPVRMTGLEKFMRNWSYNLRYRTGEAIQFPLYSVISSANGWAALEQGFNTGRAALENGSVFGALQGISGTLYYTATALISFSVAKDAQKLLTRKLPLPD